MFFELKELPFAPNLLEPHISEETIEYHYGKHHLGYVNKLNDLIGGTRFEAESLEEIVRQSSGDIFSNAAQIWNHDFYWQGIAPDDTNKHPGEILLSMIERRFGDYFKFEKEFKKIALSNFGSGWTWLVKSPRGLLDIINTSNANNPLFFGDKPLLVCDTWEHAYYIDYRDDRKKVP